MHLMSLPVCDSTKCGTIRHFFTSWIEKQKGEAETKIVVWNFIGFLCVLRLNKPYLKCFLGFCHVRCDVYKAKHFMFDWVVLKLKVQEFSNLVFVKSLTILLWRKWLGWSLTTWQSGHILEAFWAKALYRMLMYQITSSGLVNTHVLGESSFCQLISSFHYVIFHEFSVESLAWLSACDLCLSGCSTTVVL